MVNELLTLEAKVSQTAENRDFPGVQARQILQNASKSRANYFNGVKMRAKQIRRCPDSASKGSLDQQEWKIGTPMFSDESGLLVQFLLALGVVLLLILLLAWVLKRLNTVSTRIGRQGEAPRLAVQEAIQVDHKRKLVLLRRDHIEHLVLIGGENDLLVEHHILPQQPLQPAPTQPRPPIQQQARPQPPAPAPAQTAQTQGQPKAAQPLPATPPRPATPTVSASGPAIPTDATKAPNNRTQSSAPASPPAKEGDKTSAPEGKEPRTLTSRASSLTSTVTSTLPLAKDTKTDTDPTQAKPDPKAKSGIDAPKPSEAAPQGLPPRPPLASPEQTPPPAKQDTPLASAAAPSEPERNAQDNAGDSNGKAPPVSITHTPEKPEAQTSTKTDPKEQTEPPREPSEPNKQGDKDVTQAPEVTIDDGSESDPKAGASKPQAEPRPASSYDDEINRLLNELSGEPKK